MVSFAFSLVRRSLGCHILGREFGKGLVSLIERLTPSSLDDLAKKLPMFLEREVAKFERKQDFGSADSIRDRVECISIFVSASESLNALLSRITSLFDDSSSNLLTLATIHKAKGLEWPKVFLLDFHKLCPSPWAKLPWQKVQERNLQYVAVTRAKLDLVFINSGNWKEKAKVEISQPRVELSNQPFDDLD